MNKRILALATGAFAIAASPVFAQDVDLRPVRARAGGAFTIASPTGEFADYVGTGWGLNGHFTLGLAAEGALGLRFGAGFINYGNETKTVCLSQTVGCRITVDLTTSNNIGYANLGPELAVPVGPVQPYVNLSAGFSYFATMSSVKGTANVGGDDFANTTNFDDFTFAWQAGAGLRIALPVRRTPVAIDLGLRYHTNGEAEYLREGGIEDDPVTGAITLHPIRSEANLVAINIGVTAGIRW
jgi:opacity protein-like surface antigen